MTNESKKYLPIEKINTGFPINHTCMSSEVLVFVTAPCAVAGIKYVLIKPLLRSQTETKR